jgi:hypothetical protein
VLNASCPAWRAHASRPAGSGLMLRGRPYSQSASSLLLPRGCLVRRGPFFRDILLKEGECRARSIDWQRGCEDVAAIAFQIPRVGSREGTSFCCNASFLLRHHRTGDTRTMPLRLCVGLAPESKFPGATTRRCRVRLQRPVPIYIVTSNKETI